MSRVSERDAVLNYWRNWQLSRIRDNAPIQQPDRENLKYVAISYLSALFEAAHGSDTPDDLPTRPVKYPN